MLNDQAFLLLAGNPKKWDDELLASYPHTSFVIMQKKQHQAGRRSAELVHGQFGYYVRYASSLDNLDILARPGKEVDGSYLSAVEWGEKWANENPKNREFFVKRILHESAI